MYYCSGFSNAEILVTDTRDNVTERFTREQLVNILISNRNLTVFGATVDSKRNLGAVIKKNFKSAFEKNLFSMNIEVGTPIELRYSGNLPCTPVLFCGIQQNIRNKSPFFDNTYYFFDGSGDSGTFGLSSSYISAHSEEMSISRVITDTARVNHLLDMIKGCKSKGEVV